MKNTLTKIAAERAGIDSLDELLIGPSAVAFITGDPVEAAKGLREFAGEPRAGDQGRRPRRQATHRRPDRQVADLESREVLLSKWPAPSTPRVNAAGCSPLRCRRPPGSWPHSSRSGRPTAAADGSESPARGGLLSAETSTRGSRTRQASSEEAAPEAPTAEAASPEDAAPSGEPEQPTPDQHRPNSTTSLTAGPEPPDRGTHQKVFHKERKRSPWPSSPPLSCSTRSRR